METTLKSTLCAAVALVAAFSATTAFAETTSHSERHCGWTRQGAYACATTSESDDAKTSTLCASGTYDTYCKTTTKLKEQPAPEPVYSPPTVEQQTFAPGVYERAEERARENAKAGRTGVVVCGPDHWVKNHWEPSCR